MHCAVHTPLLHRLDELTDTHVREAIKHFTEEREKSNFELRICVSVDVVIGLDHDESLVR